MIFESRIQKAVAHFIDYDSDHRKFSRWFSITASDDGDHVLIKANGKVFKEITRSEWEDLASHHKRALFSNNIYNWNTYTVYGFLGEKGLLEDFMKCAATTTN